MELIPAYLPLCIVCWDVAWFRAPALVRAYALGAPFSLGDTQPKELATFLGRSVGVFIIVLAVFAFRAVNIPTVQPFFFDMLFGILIGSILIHIYGAISKAQPITETVEILMWFLLLFATIAFYPS